MDLSHHAKAVVQVLPEDGPAGQRWRVSWIDGPDEAAMRELVERLLPHSLPPMTITISGYDRLPMPDFADVAEAAMRFSDPTGDAPPETRAELVADLVGRLETGYREHGYRYVHGMANILLGRDQGDVSPLPLGRT
ncbi:hypothetical protein NQK81_02130 [Amycolatopsis roodepoortensis]|uniref:hypothetical protein n=1 Tax=Amycolatopsis roodepoortensis TaxID=700274 RepID=UPI00214BC108|nr:hypothetical protein [Amycolatopsis roodepoortensis]UUV32272.1 hypothetical protein NQK81_02130 [Amycolatopsis roodepoortensis]